MKFSETFVSYFYLNCKTKYPWNVFQSPNRKIKYCKMFFFFPIPKLGTTKFNTFKIVLISKFTYFTIFQETGAVRFLAPSPHFINFFSIPCMTNFAEIISPLTKGRGNHVVLTQYLWGDGLLVMMHDYKSSTF